MRPKIKELMDSIQATQRDLGFNPEKTYLVYGDDKEWVNSLHSSAGSNIDLRAVSNIKDLKAVLACNEDACVVLSCSCGQNCGMDIAKELNLLNGQNELIFSAPSEPSKTVFSMMKQLGCKFVRNDGNFWENISKASSPELAT